MYLHTYIGRGSVWSVFSVHPLPSEGYGLVLEAVARLRVMSAAL